jgi:hypothetical protein
MVTSMRNLSWRMLVACALILLAAQIVPSAALRAEEKKSCMLVFALQEGTLLHYTFFAQTEQNYGGSDVTMNQTNSVDMSCAAKADSTGASKIDLKFIKVKSSLVMNGQLQQWEPPIKLEGVELKVSVSPAAEIVHFDMPRNVVGLRNPDDLREIINPWFVKLPDTMTTVGQTWKKRIAEGKREGGEPEVTGEGVYTLKKIETRGNMQVAFVEGKANLKINQDTPAGTLVADGTVDLKAQIAVPGGYILELKQNLEIRGNTVAKDPITDRETKRQTALTRNTEIKLQQ